MNFSRILLQRTFPICLSISIAVLAILAYGYWGAFGKVRAYQLQLAQERSKMDEVKSFMAGFTGGTDELATRLAQRMQTRPNDPKGWQLLAKLYFRLGKYQEAYNAFGKANALISNQVDLMAGLVESDFLLHDGQLSAQGIQWADALTKLEPHNTAMMNIKALHAFKAGHWADAINSWQILLKQLPVGSADRKAVEQALVDARAKHVQEFNKNAVVPSSNSNV